jgi:hypothetical protein
MESPSVRGSVGNHFADWCNNPEPELKEAIKKSLDTGLLRLEITFYRYNVDGILTQDYIEEQMDYLETIIPPTLLFYNPISTQWKLLLNKVKFNLVIVDVVKKLSFVCLYLNKETGKTNGFYIKDTTNNILSNISKLYTFDLPIIILLVSIPSSPSTKANKTIKKDIKEDIIKEENNIEIQQDTYLKVLDKEERKTYCNNGEEYFKQHYITETEQQPSQMGLIHTDKCKLEIQTRKEDFMKKLSTNIPIKFQTFEYKLLREDTKGNTTLREENKKIKADIQQERLEEEAEQFTREHIDKIAKVMEENKDMEIKRKIKEHNNGIEKILFAAFNQTFGNIEKLIDLRDGSILHCYGYRTFRGKFGLQKILACSDTEPQDEDNLLTAYWAVSEINQFIDKYTHNWMELDSKNLRYNTEEYKCYGTLKGFPLFSFRKVGVGYNSQRNRQVIIEILQKRNNKEEIENNNIDPFLQQIATTITGTKTIDKLIEEGKIKEGEILYITGYREFKQKLLLEIQHGADNEKDCPTTDYTIANYWLKEIFKDGGEKRKFSVVVSSFLNTPQKHKEHTFIAKLETENKKAC